MDLYHVSNERLDQLVEKMNLDLRRIRRVRVPMRQLLNMTWLTEEPPGYVEIHRVKLPKDFVVLRVSVDQLPMTLQVVIWHPSFEPTCMKGDEVPPLEEGEFFYTYVRALATPQEVSARLDQQQLADEPMVLPS